MDENDKTGEITKILQVVPEDYSEEGQDQALVVQNNDENYNLNVEIFVSWVEIEFTEISCVGAGGQLDYEVFIEDPSGNEIRRNEGNIECSGTNSASVLNIIYNNEDEIELGDYQATIAFTNSGIPVQANWDYSFAIVYDF